MVPANAMQIEAVWHPSGAQVMLSSHQWRLFAETTSRTTNGFNCNIVHRLHKLDKILQSHQTYNRKIADAAVIK